jgi:hypothetical protein
MVVTVPTHGWLRPPHDASSAKRSEAAGITKRREYMLWEVWGHDQEIKPTRSA